LVAGNALNCLFTDTSSFQRYLRFGVTHFNGGGVVKSCRKEGFVIDERGKLKRFNKKKLSRRRCGSLRGRGWKYGSGFVDGIFPVLSPIAQKIVSFIQRETDPEKVADVLGTLPSTHASWDDLINVAVQLRLNKKWDPIVLVCEWILRRSSFQPDDLKYADSHEWVKIDGNKATFGITDHAQDHLGDVVYVELPDLGRSVSQGESFGAVESVKATSDINSPVSGKVVEVNEVLTESPGLVNTSPYEEGWIIKVELSDAGEVEKLMDSDKYSKFCEEEDAKH
ncbi:hypothetical protein DY000_02029470, partial [Brassica cretica]